MNKKLFVPLLVLALMLPITVKADSFCVSNDACIYAGRVSGGAIYPAIPNCADTAGQHLNFNSTTLAWTCGTSGASSITTSFADIASSSTSFTRTVTQSVNTSIQSYTSNATPISIECDGLTTCSIELGQFPAKTVIRNMYAIVITQATSPATLTFSCGVTGAGYIDLIVASNAKAAANTVYGDASAERGTNLTGYFMPSYTGATALICQYVGATDLAAMNGSLLVVIETEVIP
jgi:hypothetical protein